MEPLIKLRVKLRSSNQVIGYEIFTNGIGWQSGFITTLDESELTRDLYTGIQDKNRKEIYANDTVKKDSGEIYVIKWNQQQSSWWLMLTDNNEVWDFPERLGGSKELIFVQYYNYPQEQNLGNGYFHRSDLIIIE